ncbi:MAG TPA: WD40 repeat domain-containing protein [Tepidisphaeraceae bacterium]|nr:WD40 repeat domain-containing protein [Tepidisphaeraceae bacterium]
MRNKRWLLVWLGIGALFVGPPAVLLTRERFKAHARFLEDTWALRQPPIVVAMGDAGGVLEDGEIGVLRPFRGIMPGTLTVAVSPDGKLALCAANPTLHLVDLQTHKVVGTAQNGSDGQAVCFLPDGKQALAIQWNGLFQFDLTSNPPLQVTANTLGNLGPGTCVAISPNGCTAVTGGSASGSVHVWNLKSGRELGRLDTPAVDSRSGGMVKAVAYSPDGNQLYCIRLDGMLCCWNIHTGQSVYVLKTYSAYVRIAEFSRDGRFLLIGGDNQTAQLWDLAQRKVIWKSEPHSSMVYQVALSHDGRRAVTQSENDLILWDTSTGQKLSSIRIEGRKMSILTAPKALALHPDGRHVIVGGSQPGIVTMTK